MNILQEYNATSEQRIDDKTDLYSVTTEDVGQTIREGVELALLYPQSNVLFTYPKDFITRDGSYALFISLADNVSGDTTNSSNWQVISALGASQSVYDLGVITDDFANGYNATIPAISAYSSSNIYLFKPDTTNTGASTLQINSLSAMPIRKYNSGIISDVASGDLNFTNTYLLIYKTNYFLVVSSIGGDGSQDLESVLVQGADAGGIKIENIGDALADQDVPSYKQLLRLMASDSTNYDTTDGTNTYTATPDVLFPPTSQGTTRKIKITNTSTELCSINYFGIGEIPIYKTPSTQAGSGDLLSGYIYLIVFDNTIGGYLIIGGVSGGGGSDPYEEEITCDSVIDSYTITHNLNTFSPIVALWFLKLDEGLGFDAWIPQDVTQGIYVNSTDPDVIFFNPMAYNGNASGIKYKIRIK